MILSWLRTTRKADKVILVPSFDHALKKAADQAPFEIRCLWCAELAQACSGPGFSVVVSNIEKFLPQPSYTLKTLEALQESDWRVQLVVGADILDERDHWHRWDEIAYRFSPIIVGRGGYPPVLGSPTFPDVSSTEIRRLIADGQSVEHLVPRGVLETLDWGARSSS
jgi:nicotinate (nicotinamide) nucleotide adenylyltransferase